MQHLELFPYVHLHITTFMVWKNNIGKGVLNIFLKGGNQRRGIIYKGGDKCPLQTMECFWVHSYLVELHRSSHQRCSEKKGVLESFSKFTGKDVVFSRPATLLKNHLCFVSIYCFKHMKVGISGKTRSKYGRKSKGIFQKNTPYFFVFHFKNFMMCYISIFFLDLNKTLMSQNLT